MWYYDYYGLNPRRSQQMRPRDVEDEEEGRDGLQTLRGEVVRTKRVETEGTTYQAALLETDQGRRVIVDLGPVQDLRNENVSVQRGQDIQVRGRYANVGDYRVFMAHQVRSDGQVAEIGRRALPSRERVREEERMQTRRGQPGGEEERLQTRRGRSGDGEEESAEETEQQGGREVGGLQLRTINGQILRTQEIKLPEMKERLLVALLRTDQGRRALAVLGPVQELQDLDLNQGDQVSVQGLCLHMDGHPVCLTQQLRAHGQTLQAAQRANEKMVRPSSQVRGKVIRTKEIDLPGINEEVMVAVVQGEDGQKYIAGLGTAEDLDRVQLGRGDQVTIRGPEFRIGDHRFLLGRELNANGQTVRIGESERRGGEER
jgi:hypothetical protein